MFFSRPAGHTWYSRNDPVNEDFAQGVFTKDGTWYDLDLSGIIGKGVKLVMLGVYALTVGNTGGFHVRTNGNANEQNVSACYTQADSFNYGRDMWVVTDADGKIEYKAENVTWVGLDVTVRGWFA